MPKELLFNKEARQVLTVGVNKLADAVETTLGPRGRHVVIAQSWTSPKVTKDGVTVAMAVELMDMIENMGAELVKEAAQQTAVSAGDGTTTSIVLAREIVNLGMAAIEKGANPVALKRGLDAAVQAVVSYIKHKAIPIGEDLAEVENIATVSANNDPVIGKLIAEAMKLVTKNGIIRVQDSKTLETFVSSVIGMHFDRGYLSTAFINKQEEMTSTYENAFVLICEDKITNAQAIYPILEKVIPSGRPLLIIADDYDAPALDTIITNRVRGQLQICAIKAPGYGDRRSAILDDIALLTDGQVIGSKRIQGLKGLELIHLGQVKQFIVDHENTILEEGKGIMTNPEKIASRIKEIETLIANSTSQYDIDQNRDRIAKLSGGIAVINVGAMSEVEMREKKDRVEDALGATKAAVLEGILPGGGVALARAAMILGVDNNSWNFRTLSDMEKGFKILATALLRPLKAIVENTGISGEKVLRNVLRNEEFNYGYNSFTDTYENLFIAGVVDPAKVTRVALTHAVSVAGMILTTECLISPDAEEEKKRMATFDHNSSFSGIG